MTAVTSKVGCVSFGVIVTRALLIPGDNARNKFPWLCESQEESIWQEKKFQDNCVLSQECREERRGRHNEKFRPQKQSTLTVRKMIKNKTDREAWCASGSCVHEVGKIHGFPVTYQKQMGK